MARPILAILAAIACAILLLPAFGAAILLALFAGLVRAIAGRLEQPFVAWTDLMTFDPTLGWIPRPHIDAHYLADRDDVFRVVTDGEGWPGRRSLDQSDVVVVGDSFAFGYGVDTGRCFAEVDPDLPVKAVAAPGYSMVQGVLLMEHLTPRLRGKLVVWFVYMENDLQDNLAPEMRGYRAPFARLDRVRGEWTIVASHVAPEKWRCSESDSRRLFPLLCVPGPLADHAYAACDYLIERAQGACLRAGARLAVVTIPHPSQLSAHGVSQLAALSGTPAWFDEDLPDLRIGDICRRHGVGMVAAKDVLGPGDYKRREGIHWNERGHRRMAAVVRSLYESFTADESHELTPRLAAADGSFN